MLPFLQLLEDGQPHRLHEVASQLADDFHLTETERSEQLPSGRQSRFVNRVGWARTHLGKAGLLESATPRGIRITARGRALLAEKPTRIDMRVLGRYPEYAAFRRGTATVVTNGGSVIDLPETPDEVMSQAYKQLEATLADDLLAQIRKVSPSFFERLVVDVLTAMGYGGSIDDAARVLGRTGDGGVDGVINEDRLGLDVVDVQSQALGGIRGPPSGTGFCRQSGRIPSEKGCSDSRCHLKRSAAVDSVFAFLPSPRHSGTSQSWFYGRERRGHLAGAQSLRTRGRRSSRPFAAP